MAEAVIAHKTQQAIQTLTNLQQAKLSDQSAPQVESLSHDTYQEEFPNIILWNVHLLNAGYQNAEFLRSKEPTTTQTRSEKAQRDETKKYKCMKCHRCYGWKYSLTRHNCKPKKTSVCNLCEKDFKYPCYLKKHRCQFQSQQSKVTSDAVKTPGIILSCVGTSPSPYRPSTNTLAPSHHMSLSTCRLDYNPNLSLNSPNTPTKRSFGSVESVPKLPMIPTPKKPRLSHLATYCPKIWMKSLENCDTSGSSQADLQVRLASLNRSHAFRFFADRNGRSDQNAKFSSSRTC